MTEKDQQEKRLGKSLNTQNTFHFIARGLKNVFFMPFVALNASALPLSDYNAKNISLNPSSKLYMADVLYRNLLYVIYINFYARIQI